METPKDSEKAPNELGREGDAFNAPTVVGEATEDIMALLRAAAEGAPRPLTPVPPGPDSEDGPASQRTTVPPPAARPELEPEPATTDAPAASSSLSPQSTGGPTGTVPLAWKPQGLPAGTPTAVTPAVSAARAPIPSWLVTVLAAGAVILSVSAALSFCR